MVHWTSVTTPEFNSWTNVCFSLSFLTFVSLSLLLFYHSSLIFSIVILSWFIDEKVAERALKHNDLIQEEDVECKPERLPDAVLDENVDIHLVRKHFTTDAWVLVQEVFKQKSSHNAWICHSCYHDLHSEQSIVCDSCLLWFHFKCVGLVRQPKCKNWFCRSCIAKVK